MSIHYLIDPFTTNGDIIDVITAESGQTDATGATVVRVPDGVAIHNIPTNPTNVTDLLTKKYDGLLGFYAGFTQIVGDSCMGGDNLTTITAGFKSDGFVNHGLFHKITPSFEPAANFGPIALIDPITLLPVSPTQCVVTWELFSFTESNDKTGRYQRIYVEEDPNILACAVSFDGGPPSIPTTDSTVLNIPVPSQGSSFSIRLSNAFTPTRHYLGSWALIF